MSSVVHYGVFCITKESKWFAPCSYEGARATENPKKVTCKKCLALMTGDTCELNPIGNDIAESIYRKGIYGGVHKLSGYLSISAIILSRLMVSRSEPFPRHLLNQLKDIGVIEDTPIRARAVIETKSGLCYAVGLSEQQQESLNDFVRNMFDEKIPIHHEPFGFVNEMTPEKRLCPFTDKNGDEIYEFDSVIDSHGFRYTVIYDKNHLVEKFKWRMISPTSYCDSAISNHCNHLTVIKSGGKDE